MTPTAATAARRPAKTLLTSAKAAQNPPAQVITGTVLRRSEWTLHLHTPTVLKLMTIHGYGKVTELSEACGVSRPTMHVAMAGKAVTDKVARKLATALGVRPDMISFWKEAA